MILQNTYNAFFGLKKKISAFPQSLLKIEGNGQLFSSSFKNFKPAFAIFSTVKYINYKLRCILKKFFFKYLGEFIALNCPNFHT